MYKSLKSVFRLVWPQPHCSYFAASLKVWGIWTQSSSIFYSPKCISKQRLTDGQLTFSFMYANSREKQVTKYDTNFCVGKYVERNFTRPYSKWDFHLSHVVPVHPLAAFLHMPPNILIARHDFLFSQNTFLFILIYLHYYFFCCIGELHISFILCCQTFVFLFGFKREEGFKNRESLGWHCVRLVSLLRQLVSASAPRLPGHPVDDDKRQTHDHEDDSQRSKACSLQEGKGINGHWYQQHTSTN